jgi:hypothetical protein
MTDRIDTPGNATSVELLGLMSRRSLLRSGALAGGLAVAGGMFGEAVARAGSGAVTPAGKIFQITQTAEQLAVTLYSRGVANGLGLEDDDLDYFKAAAIHEQIHQRFFATLTGVAVQPSTHFSFPAGSMTFSDLRTFVIAQQHLEGVFDTAFLAAVRELAAQGRPREAQIMAQIACNEAEHRVLARQIAAEAGFERLPNINPGGSGTVPTGPPDNWAYTPVFFHTTPQVVDLVKADGFMSPRPGNSFEYRPIDFHDSVYGDVFERITFRTPFAK